MSRNQIAAALVAGCLLLANHGLAKPPDLPVDLKVRCEEKAPSKPANALRALSNVDINEWQVGLSVSGPLQTPAIEPECYPCPDVCLAVGGCLGWTVQALLGQCPPDAEKLTVMPKVVRRKRTVTPAASQEEQDARELEELHRRAHQLRLQSQATPAPQQEEDAWRERMAKRLYHIAEGCRRNGDHEMAYNCYCEVELLVPNSSLGERARKQMSECQRHLGAAEEAEPMDAEVEITPVDKLEIK